jgi:hypothetical protein
VLLEGSLAPVWRPDLFLSYFHHIDSGSASYNDVFDLWLGSVETGQER